MYEDCEHEVIVWWSHEHHAFFAEVPDLPDCTSKGHTRIEAIKNTKRAIRLWPRELASASTRAALSHGGRAGRVKKGMERSPPPGAALQHQAFAPRPIRAEDL
jgi:predicted RNase H-like HicB family nuclease